MCNKSRIGGQGISGVLVVVLLVILSMGISSAGMAATINPSIPAGKRVGIVYSGTARQHFWDVTSYARLFMSTQSQVRMAGIPYDLLTDEDLLDLKKLEHYQTLIFPVATTIDAARLPRITQNLHTISRQFHTGFITAGDFLTNGQDNQPLPGDSYERMKTLFGLTPQGWAGPVRVKLKAADVQHPAIRAGQYRQGETLLDLAEGYVGYFTADEGVTSAVLATQDIDHQGRFNAVIATEQGGRNVHFAAPQYMLNTNLLWSALQWSVFGDEPVASLQMGRQSALFAARNDMDQSMYAEKAPLAHTELLQLIRQWKQKFDFLGSYYLNVGNQPEKNQYTRWAVSAPLYRQYLEEGNEIGTHSLSHPFDTNKLTADQLKYEFVTSRQVIEQQLGLSDIGAAVPGATENLPISLAILPYVRYLSGGYSAGTAGFANAFGYLDPDQDKVYLNPNMTFDFSLLEYQKKTAAQARDAWLDELDTLARHASLPVIHWPWHDYAALNLDDTGYTLDMFEALLKKASDSGAEFITVGDLVNRIASFHAARLQVQAKDAENLSVDVAAPDVSAFSLRMPGQIAAVKDWYAWDGSKVFLAGKGGQFDVRLGERPAAVTRISRLPVRSRLRAVSGDGKQLDFVLEGEGTVVISPYCPPAAVRVSGAVNQAELRDGRVHVEFPQAGLHQPVHVELSCQQ